jgi:hypothetical protein
LKQPRQGPGAVKNPQVLLVRSERRSWITIAITAFGALLLRYLKTVRERGFEPRRRLEADAKRSKTKGDKPKSTDH